MQSTKPTSGDVMPQASAANATLTRRDVIKAAAAGAGVVMMIPAIQGRTHAADGDWQVAGKAADFPKGVPQRVALKGGAVLLVTRTSDTDVTAVSAKCTHRGCELGWNTDQKELICPCHGGVFAADGKNIHGTQRHPEKNLPALQAVPARLNNGQVEVNPANIPADSLTPQRDA